MYITELHLATHELKQQKDFYVHTLGLTILNETETSVTFQVGETKLVFFQSETEKRPFYHFAFNIPNNKFTLAKTWLALLCPLLEMDGEDQVTHNAWNAQSFYFYDPAGNVVEFIARYNLANATGGVFNSHDLLNVSEIGLVVDDVLSTTEAIKSALDEKVWKEQSDTFTAMGDDRGLLIIAKLGRIWLLTDKPAEVHPFTVVIRSATSLHFQIVGFPYHIDTIPDNLTP